MKRSGKLNEVLEAVAKDSGTLNLLKDDPGKLAEEFNLGKEQMEALKGADLLLVFREKNPLMAKSTTTYTFSTGSTITGKRPSLYDIPKEELVQLVERVLTERDYAQRVREFLNL